MSDKRVPHHARPAANAAANAADAANVSARASVNYAAHHAVDAAAQATFWSIRNSTAWDGPWDALKRDIITAFPPLRMQEAADYATAHGDAPGRVNSR